MNQDQIKAFLKKVRPTSVDFKVILTGKASRKVNGLYKPETSEILLHNKNFTQEADMLRTSLHEYAHHLHYHSPNPPRPGRPHTPEFWAIFHDLLQEAEKKGLYTDVFRSDPEFVALTQAIRKNFLEPYGNLIYAFGEKLLLAEEICRKRSLNFRDYVERELGLKLPTARMGMNTVRRALNPALGPDKLKTLSQLPAQAVATASQFFAAGATEAQVRAKLSSLSTDSNNNKSADSNSMKMLEKKKNYLKKLIEKYQKELEEIESKMNAISGKKES